MIFVKNQDQLKLMRVPCGIVRDALNLVEENIKEGVSTAYLDKLVYDFITKQGATPSFLNYSGFPKSICASIDNEVVHGIPSEKRLLKEGSIISVDIGAFKNGFHGDAARTFAVGNIDSKKQQLIDVTKQSFFEGAKVVRENARIGDIGNAIDSFVKKFGFSTVKVLIGHGIGQELHEKPDIPNYGIKGRGLRLTSGMTICIEPMVNMGDYAVEFLNDGWTCVTRDGLPSAHYENTIVVTEDGCEILTL